MTPPFIPEKVKRFFPAFLLCLGLLLVVSSAATGQGLIGDSACGVGTITPSAGMPAPFQASFCGSTSARPFTIRGILPGIFSAGYHYHNYSFTNAARFSELRLSYYLPLRIGFPGALTPYARAQITNLRRSPQTFGLADTILRFGGSWIYRVRKGLYVGAKGEFNETRREGKWYAGGQGAIEMYQYVAGCYLASLTVNYYSESAGNLFIFPKSPSGYAVRIGYWHNLFASGQWLNLTASGYNIDCVQRDKLRGWDLGARLLIARSLLSLKASVGRASVIGSHYTVGADAYITF